MPGSPDTLLGVVDAAPGAGPGGFVDAVCGATVRSVPLAPYAAWLSEHT